MKKCRAIFVFCVFVFLITFRRLFINSHGYPAARKNSTTGKQPNIVLVVADDYGWNDIGYHGSEIRTPTLDKLASEGVKLENYYVQPMCSPSRSQLMSGMYQIHTGLQHFVILHGHPLGLPLEFPTIADKLKEVGYSTHIVGKWHVGCYTKAHLPTSRGFDTFYGHLNGGGGYYNHTQCNSGMCGIDLWENDEPRNNTEGTYSTFRFANRAIDIINRHDKRKPLFLYLPFRAVHRPLEVPGEYLRQYANIKDDKRRIYAGMVTCMDEAIRNVTRSLRKQGLWENTAFVFTTGIYNESDDIRTFIDPGKYENKTPSLSTVTESLIPDYKDNGGRPSSGGNNWPLRGGKQELWEGGIHGIGFITSPLLDQKVKGTTSRALIHVSDWYPTLVNLARGKLDGPQVLDGMDQWKTLNGGPSCRRELLHSIDPLSKPHGKPSLKSNFNTTTTAALRYGDWKILTGSPGRGVWVPSPANKELVPKVPAKTKQNVWLFNITSDPLEEHDVAEQYPQVVDNLLTKLKGYEDASVPCRFPPADNKADPKLRGGHWGPWL